VEEEVVTRVVKRVSVLGCVLIVAVLAGGAFRSAPSAQASSFTTIFSNLGTGGTVYNCCAGWSVSGSSSANTDQFWNANAFTPAADAEITRIDVAIGNLSGTNGVTLQLATDSGGVPGTVLRTWHLTGLPAFGTCCTLDTTGTAVFVHQSQQYWLVALPAAGDTYDAWNVAPTDGTGPVKSNEAGTGWVTFGSTQGAFDVIGIACPSGARCFGS